jgi:hypothetical protein
MPDIKEFSTTTITKLFYRFMKFSLKSLYEVANSGDVDSSSFENTFVLPDTAAYDINQAHVERIRQTFFESMNALLDGFEWLAVHWKEDYELRNGLIVSHTLSPGGIADSVDEERESWWGDCSKNARPTTTLRGNSNIDIRSIVSSPFFALTGIGYPHSCRRQRSRVFENSNDS